MAERAIIVYRAKILKVWEFLPREWDRINPPKLLLTTNDKEITHEATQKQEEVVVLLHGRPVLFIQKSIIVLPSDLSGDWKKVLVGKDTLFRRVLNAVGRINLTNADLSWAGTGWLISDDIVVTNRHVASCFALATGAYRSNIRNKKLRASINFREEHNEDDEGKFTYELGKVLYIAPDNSTSPDIAFIKIEWGSKEKITPIPLAEQDVTHDQLIAVVGYPAHDSHNNLGTYDWTRIFQDIYDVKRFQPGRAKRIEENYFTHDCTTLSGNSGSVVIDIKTGAAVGLHFGGAVSKENYAVPISVVRRTMRIFCREFLENIVQNRKY